eukprot:2556701-Pyramimonas_sp.AAC.1
MGNRAAEGESTDGPTKSGTVDGGERERRAKQNALAEGLRPAEGIRPTPRVRSTDVAQQWHHVGELI